MNVIPNDKDLNPLFTATNPGHVTQSPSMTSAAEVTPDDDNDLPNGSTKYLYVGGAGDLKIDMADGSTVTLVAVPAGTLLPFSVKRVYLSDTNADYILALY